MSREIQELRSQREGENATSTSPEVGASTGYSSEPTPGSTTDDDFDLNEVTVVLKDVLVESQLAVDAFKIFAELFRPQLPILESILLRETYLSQPFLFWTIVVVVSSHLTEGPHVDLYTRLREPYMALLREEALTAPLPLHKIQALLFLCAWPLPIASQVSDPSWLYCGIAIQAARYMGLDREQPLPSVRSMGVLPGTSRARINTWLGCFYVGTSLGLHLGLQPPIDSDIDFTAIHNFLTQKTLPFEIATHVRIQLVVARFTNLLLQNNDTVGSSMIRLINSELDALKSAFPEREPGGLKVEFSILVTKLYFYSLLIAKSPPASSSRDVLLQTGLVAALRIIRISTTPSRTPARLGDRELPPVQRDRSMPKTYYRGLAFATIFLLIFFYLNASATREEQESAGSHISLAQGIFKRCSIDPLDEYSRTAKLFEILARLPPGSSDPTKLRFTHRMGLSVLLHATRIADEARGRPVELVAEGTVSEPVATYQNQPQDQELPQDMLYNMDQTNSDAEFLKGFWDESFMNIFNLDVMYAPEE
ncbi:hypothetical protein B0J13DRAFT_569435 [Dactylonectria estremocensis]|uniref:Xylanolytic transcriptional activator regulatory domain-containing protein n=1 Tax=Dactylonectria estremocensis TaxID=1079267 RepID=A0A9P9IGL4_9HYPO|nr:hypothetical protein B0J13DRAFT_569435 [Dactylonectria estremocensis]